MGLKTESWEGAYLPQDLGGMTEGSSGVELPSADSSLANSGGSPTASSSGAASGADGGHLPCRGLLKFPVLFQAMSLAP